MWGAEPGSMVPLISLTVPHHHPLLWLLRNLVCTILSEQDILWILKNYFRDLYRPIDPYTEKHFWISEQMDYMAADPLALNILYLWAGAIP